ncbi:MAG: tetratricopeptide repeat protein [Salinivirgaceae bacterium]|jgi:signal transduction histidine kinase/DNA-binding NarL/FixJ family response regulator/Tfp pilus assembly protein PilF|nr:tetratricopeptide repeat protein [Salinivirgaceae bacterium]
MRQIKIIILLVFGIQHVYGTDIDSLLVQSQSEIDTIKYESLLQLSTKYRNRSIDTAAMFLKEAKGMLPDLLQSVPPEEAYRWQWRYYKQQGLFFQRTDQYDSATNCYQTMMQLAEKAENKQIEGEALNNLGVLNEQQANYPAALDYYFKLLRLYDSIDKPVLESRVFVNIGVVYFRQEKFDDALEYYQKALKLKRKLGDRKGEALVYNNIGIIYYYLENYSKVLENFKRSLVIYRELNDLRSQAMPYYNIAEIYKEQNSLKEALYYYKKAYDIEKALDDISGQAETLETIGNVYLNLKQYTKAVRVQKEAVRLLEGLGAKRELSEAYYSLSATYEILDNFENALSYYKKYKHQADSIHTIQKEKALAQIKEAYESEKKDSEITLLTERNRLANLEREQQKAMITSQRRITVLSLFLVALVLFVLIMVYRSYRQKRLSHQMLEFKNNAISRKNAQITEMVNKLESALRAREVFFSNTTHELRTPLNIINGFTNLLLNTSQDRQHLYYINNIKSSTSHLLQLIEDLLAVSQLETGQLKLHKHGVKFDVYIHTILAPFKVLASQKQQEFIYEIAENVPEFLHVDPLRFRQVLGNLVDNAIKYTPRKGAVSVVFRYENDAIIFRVNDSGVGLSEYDQSVIFDRYSRLLGATEEQTSTGLGLSIVRTLTELQQGIIHVDSKLGEGTTFLVEIPAEISPKATYSFSPNASILPAPDLRYGRVLLVEDNQANAELTVNILNIYMPTLIIDVATSGSKAIVLLKKNSYDLMLLDLKMPDMNGFELIEKYQSSEGFATKDVPVIAVSAQVRSVDKQKSKDLGIAAFVEKPYEPVQLIDEIERLRLFAPVPSEMEHQLVSSDLLTGSVDRKQLKSIVETKVPDCFSHVNTALRNKDWEVVAQKIVILRELFELFAEKELIKLINRLEKECVTTQDLEKAASIFKELMKKWEELRAKVKVAIFASA